MNAFDENFPNLKILNFFDLKVDCNKLDSKAKLLINKKYKLPSFSSMLEEDDAAKVYMSWSEKGLFFIFDVKANMEDANTSKLSIQDYKRADSIEIFIDTRSLKTKGYITKFCHHFVYMPQDIKGYRAKEITRFRLDDMHELSDAKDLKVDSIVKPKGYILNIEIPHFSLFGFNPHEINYLSFSYKINRYQMYPIHFNVSSFEHNIEKSPHLWAKMDLKK
ncbi:MAG: hypothetical protein K940chlam1_00471 [Candidatus Anoxychlamydiales bacterium]|nr:hypothetical protein [Candidatus Anoxychlamydiales bacterium]NGX35611.1 hypothetical protein [Candidatus Anoxychlamydiales bacterium]